MKIPRRKHFVSASLNFQLCLPALFWLAAISTADSLALDPNRQLNQCTLSVWNTSDGLPQNAVTALLQTQDGYLWVGTQGGLARFDGVSFSVFNRATHPALTDEFVTALAGGSAGPLWVGTRQGLIKLQDGALQRLSVEDGLPDHYVRSLLVDRHQTLWIGMYGGGLAQLREGRIETVRLAGDASDIFVRSLFEDRQGRVWIGTSIGLFRWDGSSFQLTLKTEDLGNHFVRAIAQDHEGRLWLGTEGGGIFIWSDGEVKAPEAAVSQRFRTVRTLFVDSRGSVWAGTESAGLFRFNGPRVDNAATADGLPHDSVWSLFEDRQGSLWVGTRGGLAQLKEGSATAIESRDGLSAESIRSILQGRDGTLWIGTEGGGLQAYQRETFITYDIGDGVPGLPIRSLFEDSKGTLWIGTRSGVMRFNRQGGFQRFGATDGLADESINAFEEDDEGGLWIATAAHGAIRFIDGKFQVLDQQLGLASDRVRVLLKDRHGKVWIGSEGGLTCAEKGQVKAVFKQDQGLANEFILSLHEDSSGHLWIGTAGGLSLMRDGVFVNFNELPHPDSSFSDATFRILEDDSGNLWMSTPRGIIRAARDDLVQAADKPSSKIGWERFNESDGMPTSECNGGSQPAGWKTDDGRLWFPTVRGIAIIDPSSTLSQRRAPAPQVDSIRIGDEERIAKGVIRLSPGQTSFEINYTAPSFQTPKRTRFKYQLKGFDPNWIDAGRRRAAFYTNLSPGEYQFLVVSSNGADQWSEPAALDLILEPALHQTTLFRLLVGLGALAVIALLYRSRVQSLEKRKSELRHLVDEQTEQLRKANEALRQLASVDDLTQMANHRCFLEQLGSEWRRMARVQRPLSLILIDIDFFKKYNDTYGHLAGDRCLKAVADALRGLIRREAEQLARFGGEEFVGLLPEEPLEKAVHLAEKIRESIENLRIEHQASPIAPVVTVSAGVACMVPDPDKKPESLFEAADQAMYQAKREGRNRVAVLSK